MPPVLHVALHELPRRGAQQMLPRQPARRHRQRHHVLQLVAEPVGAPRLVEGRARPHPTGQRLVQQPAIEHQVHRAVRRLDLDRARDVIPLGRDRLEDEVEVEVAIAGHQRARLVDRCRLRRGSTRPPRARPAPARSVSEEPRRDRGPPPPGPTAGRPARAAPDGPACRPCPETPCGPPSTRSGGLPGPRRPRDRRSPDSTRCAPTAPPSASPPPSR